MTIATSALARLVGDPDQFTTQVFGRVPLHVRAADREGFDDLLSLDDVDQLVASSGLRAPAFRVVRDGRTLPRSEVTRHVRIGSRPVDDLIDVAAVQRAFADGATIVLQSLHRSWPPVARLCRALEGELTHAVQANAYLTPPVAQGLHLHVDPHDVFAVQTYGSKRWVVHPPGRTDTSETEPADPWDIELQPGDVLYLPAGTRHAAQTLDSPSLHLTIGVRTHRWETLLRRLIDEALDVADLDGPLPAGWADHPGKLKLELEERLHRLRVVLERHGDPGAVLERAAATFHGSRVPDRSGGLRDVLALPRLADDSPLRRRDDLMARIEDHADVTHLVLADRRLQLPSRVVPVLERIAAMDTFRPADLDELIDQPSRLVLCRRLVREGWLTLATQTRQGRPGSSGSPRG